MEDYLGVILSVDESVGTVLDYLDQEGLTENTIVVYTSDQGFYLGEHGWFDKRFMYEESLSMPLLMRYSKEIEAGQVSGDIVLNLDFAPTFFGLCWYSQPHRNARQFPSITDSRSTTKRLADIHVLSLL